MNTFMDTFTHCESKYATLSELRLTLAALPALYSILESLRYNPSKSQIGIRDSGAFAKIIS